MMPVAIAASLLRVADWVIHRADRWRNREGDLPSELPAEAYGVAEASS